MAPPLDDIRKKTDAKADFGNCLVFSELYKGQFLNTSKYFMNTMIIMVCGGF